MNKTFHCSGNRNYRFGSRQSLLHMMIIRTTKQKQKSSEMVVSIVSLVTDIWSGMGIIFFSILYKVQHSRSSYRYMVKHG
uniref:Uncharacterized protein n=1 Tax=Arundo donax TaxID=35708 RepID=A0A0A8XS00_ARUDO